MEKVKDVRPGKKQECGKRKRSDFERGSCANLEPEGWLVEVTVLVKVKAET
jgi:hypothetical protein